MTEITLTDGENYGVGPVFTGYGHSPLIVSTVYDMDPREGDDETMFVCLDCGLVTGDERLFAAEGCDREDNPIPATLREKIEKEGSL